MVLSLHARRQQQAAGLEAASWAVAHKRYGRVVGSQAPTVELPGSPSTGKMRHGGPKASCAVHAGVRECAVDGGCT